MENDYPGIKPDKLLPLVQRMVGKTLKLYLENGNTGLLIIIKKEQEYLKELIKINSLHRKELNILLNKKTTNSVGQYFIQFIITIELGPLTVMVNSQERLLH